MRRNVLIAVVNFRAAPGYQVQVIRASSTLSGDPHHEVLQQVFPCSNPTSCCFSRGYLFVGGNSVSSSAGAVNLTITVSKISAAAFTSEGDGPPEKDMNIMRLISRL